MNDESLCCCEYINEEGERSHLIATLCNCEAIDEAFDRLISRKELKPELIKNIMDTLEDRFRIPWAKGARKLPASYVFPFILNFILIMLASISHYATLITYLIILPCVFYICHKLLKAKRKIYYTIRKSTSKLKLQNNFAFYKVWVISTMLYLLFIYYTYVIPSMKISSLENMLFVSLLVLSCTSLYIVVKKGQLVIESSREPKEDTIQSLELCLQCSVETPVRSSHCGICGACFTLRDHHCLWLNICIGRENERWFFAALVFSLSCLLYGAQLTLTTVCNSKSYDLGLIEILYPYQCPNAYFDFSSSLMYSGGCYSLVLITCVLYVFLQQICFVSRRNRYSNQKNKITRPCNILYKVMLNWFLFWKG